MTPIRSGAKANIRGLAGLPVTVNAVAGGRAMVAFFHWGKVDWCWVDLSQLTVPK